MTDYRDEQLRLMATSCDTALRLADEAITQVAEIRTLLGDLVNAVFAMSLGPDATGYYRAHEIADRADQWLVAHRALDQAKR